MLKLIKIALLAMILALSHSSGKVFACEPPSTGSASQTTAIELPEAKLGYSQNYLHTWIYFPAYEADDLKTGERFSFKPEQGIATVLVFLASWCIPCQQIIPDLKKLERTYSPIHTKFIYLFAYDTKQDAAGFMNDYGLSNGYFADKDTVAKYHNPKMPSIYLSDRYKCLSSRYISTTPKDLAALSHALRFMTAN